MKRIILSIAVMTTIVLQACNRNEAESISTYGDTVINGDSLQSDTTVTDTSVSLADSVGLDRMKGNNE